MQPLTKKKGDHAMTQTAQHTETPWRVFDVFSDVEIVADRPTANETESIVQFKGQQNARANAGFIVRACNTHADLIEAMQDMTEAAQAVIDNWSQGDLAAAVNGLEASIEAARTTIESATTP
jgi:aspartate/glutamate racemase